MERAQSAESTGYVIRPNFQKKFRPSVIQGCLHEVLVEQLSDKEYDSKTVHQLTTTVADAVRARMKSQELDRYKFIVQVVIGEQRGEGTKMCARCYWDADTDNFAHDLFINSSLFCVATVFGVFHY
uniref:Tctex1 domain containing 2 n=1 Tax=Plectus sambesii TaxID=2011161 RepID=A0A914UGM2_9BILA